MNQQEQNQIVRLTVYMDDAKRGPRTSVGECDELAAWARLESMQQLPAYHGHRLEKLPLVGPRPECWDWSDGFAWGLVWASVFYILAQIVRVLVR